MKASILFFAIIGFATGLNLRRAGGDVSLNPANGESFPIYTDGEQKKVAGAKIPDDLSSTYKDGYAPVACVADSMEKLADKHSDQGKKAYAAGHVGVSIIRYDLTVASEDQKQMSPTVCFNFCRSVPQMNFFGLKNGRDCYCAPYFKETAGGEGGTCDSPCAGDASQVCGGKTKSSIYGMHFCGGGKDKLLAAVSGATAILESWSAVTDTARECERDAQSLGVAVREMGGQSGNLFAADHGVAAIKLSGVLRHPMDELDANNGSLKDAKIIAEKLADEFNAGNAQDAKDSDRYIAELNSQISNGDGSFEATSAALEFCAAEGDSGLDDLSDLYREPVYFSAEEKDLVEKKSSCDGDILETHIVGDKACSHRCNSYAKNQKTCLGYQLYSYGAGHLCLLLSGIKEVNVYAKEDCTTGWSAQCHVKLSNATGFSPKVNKFDRCPPEGSKELDA